MILKECELREREVINVCDGRRLGYICDLELDTCGKICAVFLSDHGFGFGLMHGGVRIPWERIECIGEDTVLVKLTREECCPPKEAQDRKRKKNNWLPW